MLFETYADLIQKFPKGCQNLYGNKIKGQQGLWLAIDEFSYPALLFSSTPADRRSDIELRFISVQFSRECEIEIEGVPPIGGTFTIVRLTENDPELVHAFLRLLEETYCGRFAPRTNREIAEKILELADLFSRIESSSKDIIGLWGELLIISRSGTPQQAAHHWCLDKKAKYDFVFDSYALEVKTTIKPIREHRFSLEQLRPNEDLDVYVASILAVETYGGETVSDLMDGILAVIDNPKLRKALLCQCLMKGGEDIYKSSLKLQLLSDEDGISYFAASDIPVPIVEQSGPISRVKFDTCLDTSQKLNEIKRAQLIKF